MNNHLHVSQHNPDFPLETLITWTCTYKDLTFRVADTESVVNLAVLAESDTIITTTNEPGVVAHAEKRGITVREVSA